MAAETPVQEMDAARRASDAVNIHIHALGVSALGRWVAIRLSDGGSDGVLYDTKTAAMRHQLHETMCMYVYVYPEGLPVEDALVLLRQTRKMYDAGVRIAPPPWETGAEPRVL